MNQTPEETKKQLQDIFNKKMKWLQRIMEEDMESETPRFVLLLPDDNRWLPLIRENGKTGFSGIYKYESVVLFHSLDAAVIGGFEYLKDPLVRMSTRSIPLQKWAKNEILKCEDIMKNLSEICHC